MQQLEHERQGFLLEIAPAVEVDAEAVELVFAVTRAQTEGEAAVAENVDEGCVLHDPQRIGERQCHDGSADLNALGQCREIPGIDENVGHDAVFIAEMMLGDPGIVEAELIGAQDLLRDPMVNVAVGIGLGFGVRMRREKNAEFHRSPRALRKCDRCS